MNFGSVELRESRGASHASLVGQLLVTVPAYIFMLLFPLLNNN